MFQIKERKDMQGKEQQLVFAATWAGP